MRSQKKLETLNPTSLFCLEPQFPTPSQKTGPLENSCHADYDVRMKAQRTRERTHRRHAVARRLLEENGDLDSDWLKELAETWGVSLRTVYRDADWAAVQLRQGWTPPAEGDRVEIEVPSVPGPASYPHHRMAVEDSLVDGRWSNREAKRLQEAYDVPTMAEVLFSAEEVKGELREDLSGQGVRLSVSIQMKRLHRTVSRHTLSQNDDLALKAESELAKLHRGILPLLGSMDTEGEMSAEEKDFYQRLLGAVGVDA